MKKVLSIIVSAILVVSVLSGCYNQGLAKYAEEKAKDKEDSNEVLVKEKYKDFKFNVNPKTFEIIIEVDGVKEKASEPLNERKVSNLMESDNQMSWSYPDENIDIELKKEREYLNIKIRSKKEGEFNWPKANAESYILPLAEGKHIPSDDEYWKEFLSEESYTVSEAFSMQFFALNKEKNSIVYIIENMFNNEISFNTEERINFTFKHEFPSIKNNKEYGFRIYVTSKNPVDIAKVYKKYIVEKGKFTTLEEKAKTNRNIEKLYGAPYMYLWGKGYDVKLLNSIYESGVKNAWMGFDDQLFTDDKVKFVEKANEMGYLIGPYDSYHSIHEPGSEKWETASFKDETLYEEATITNKKGKKIGGFLGRGRKLNPTLSMTSVKDRVTGILSTGINLNSWFIDCDATGEFYDDYSPKHITTQEEDMEARLKRMEYIRDDLGMVIGSEGGNDFSSQTIAFAHGIETPVIKWSDADMRKNKESEYYVGGYWSPKGGVPPRYSKQVPIKELYRHIYIDPIYSVPLFKLVYNNSVITSHHWEWGSLKIKNGLKDRMLNEFLYNVPPLYHIDNEVWEKNRDTITSHVKEWSTFNRKAITKEMTDFKSLSENRLVQMTTFGSDLKVVANFSDKDFKYNDDIIKSKSLIIYDKNEKVIYTP